MRSLLLIVLFLSSCSAFSQTLNPVKWSFSYEQLSDEEGEIRMTAIIDSTWHIYSQIPADDGPIPTSFTFIETGSFKLIGPSTEPEPTKTHTEVFNATVLQFSYKAVFKQKIKRISKEEFNIAGKLEFMACNDKTCLPPRTIDIFIKVPATKAVKLIEIK